MIVRLRVPRRQRKAMTSEDATAELSDWIGNRETLVDMAAAGPVAGLAATLDRDEPAPRTGDPVPFGWHWLYFLPQPRRSNLDVDGHGKRGDLLPPVTLPRRMFGGARMTFHRPLRVGEEIRREGEIVGISEKSGRSGRLVFVTVRYRIFGSDELALEEEQDIIYREAAGATQAPPGTPAELGEVDWQRTIEPDPVLLFRFSALTFNGHRIHYDHPYVTGVEGYPGLVVQGPLTAMLLLELCRDSTGQRPLSGFRFQAKRPLFETAPFQVVGRMDADGRSCALQAVDPDGLLAMSASAAFAIG
jgi:3-methylfumaryl-CoA hydratase